MAEEGLTLTGAIAPLGAAVAPLGSARTTLDSLGQWARGNLLEIVLLVLGALLLTRLANWARGRIHTRWAERPGHQPVWRRGAGRHRRAGPGHRRREPRQRDTPARGAGSLR